MNDKLQDVLNKFKFGDMNASIQASYDLLAFGIEPVDALIEIIHDPNQRHLWWSAAKTLGYTKDKRAVEPLISLLKNPESHKAMLARKYTAYALAELADARAIDVLIEMLHEPTYRDEDDDESYTEIPEEDAETIEAAVGALANIGEWRGIKAVIERFLEGGFWCDCRMGEWGGEQAFQYLLSQVRAEDVERRSNAATLLGEFGDNRAVNTLIELLEHDPNDEVRSSAAYGLSDLYDPRAFIPTLRTLNDPNDQVRLHSMHTVRNLLMGFTRQPSEQRDMKSVFSEAILELGEQRVIDILMNATIDRVLRRSALECLPFWTPFVRDEIIRQRIIPQLIDEQYKDIYSPNH
jgi:HEAT repeat protein